MGRNLHVIRIKEASAKDAQSTVSSNLLDSVLSDNYFAIIGSISENNEFEEGNDYSDITYGKFPKDLESLKTYLMKRIRPDINKTDLSDEGFVNSIHKMIKESFEKVSKGLPHDGTDWGYARGYCNFMANAERFQNTEIDLMKDTFFDDEYTECGLSNMDENDDDEEYSTYLVLIAMHS